MIAGRRGDSLTSPVTFRPSHFTRLTSPKSHFAQVTLRPSHTSPKSHFARVTLRPSHFACHISPAVFLPYTFSNHKKCVCVCVCVCVCERKCSVCVISVSFLMVMAY